MRAEHAPPLLCAAGAIVAAGFATAGIVDDIDVLGAGLVRAAAGFATVAVAALVLAALVGCAPTSRSRTVVRHTHGGDVETARIHEGGHGDYDEHIGGRVTELVVYPDGSGYTRTRLPGNTPAVEIAAAYYAGGVAAGEAGRAPCRSDDQAAERVLRREYGAGWRDQRAEAQRRARARCAPGLFGPTAGVRRMARRVEVRR